MKIALRPLAFTLVALTLTSAFASAATVVCDVKEIAISPENVALNTESSQLTAAVDAKSGASEIHGASKLNSDIKIAVGSYKVPSSGQLALSINISSEATGATALAGSESATARGALYLQSKSSKVNSYMVSVDCAVK